MSDLERTDAISAAFHDGFGAGIGSVQDEIAERVAAAEARGYDRAIASLRDDERREAWLAELVEREQLANRPPFVQDLADYLEAQKETNS